MTTPTVPVRRRMLPRAVRAEWTKLRSVPGTTWTILALVAVTLGVTAFVANAGGTDANVGAEAGCFPRCRGDDDIVANALLGVSLGQVAMVVFGALAATSEFGTRTIRATLAAIPRRGVAFSAKAGVVGAVALALGVVVSVLSFQIAQPLQHAGGYNPPAYPHVSLADPAAARAVFGSALYLMLVALFALGVATIVRHAAAAMTTAVGLVLAPTVVLAFFPEGTIHDVAGWISPSAGLGVQVTFERFDRPPYGPLVALALTATWTLAAVLVAGWTFTRRDI